MSDLKSKPEHKRILFVTHRLQWEGAPVSLFFMAKGFKNAGYDVDVVSPSEGPVRDLYEKEGMNCTIFNFMGDDELPESLKNYDLYFVNTIIGYKFINHLDLERDKVAWIIRESEREVHFKNNPDIDPELFAKVTKVLFVANSTKDMYIDLANDNFVTINNGMDLAEVDAHIEKTDTKEMRAKLGFAEDDKIIHIVGTVSPRKGQLDFTEAAVNIINKLKNNKLKFVIIGAGNVPLYDDQIRRVIERNKMEDQIMLLDSRGSWDYYSISNMYVCTSYIESFPRVTLEAMAFKLPIVSSEVYGLSEQMDHEKEALIYMAGDKVMLEDHMTRLIQDEELANTLASNARARLEREFTFDVMMDKYFNLVSDILN